jgi:glycine dehydrogenase subunit 1
MKFLPSSDDERAAMLAAIGAKSIDALFEDVPQEVRLAKKPDIGRPLSEIEIRRDLGAVAAKNADARRYAHFLGAGCYHHYVPAIADQTLYREEWLSSYTPYQPEISQGTLQSIFEWQTHLALLTGMEVANASLYEGATALVEALLMASRLAKGRHRAVLSRNIHPEYRETVKTYFGNLSFDVVEVDDDKLAAAADAQTFAIAMQSPDFFGAVRDWRLAKDAAASCGAMAVGVVAEAISLALLTPPGEIGLDIACGEARSLGVPMSYGAPALGFLACRDVHKRQMPGRLAGETVDADGKRAFCLTLSTREQHIRREKATSNICTNQGLMALCSNVYLALMGKAGLRETAVQCASKAGYLKEKIAAVPGFQIATAGPVFNEFAVRGPRPAREVVEAMARREILAGVPLATWFPGRDREFLVAVTEMNTREEMDRYAQELAAAGRA